MSYFTFQNAAKNKLLAIPQLQTVFGSHRENPSGFPCASVEPSQNENIFITNTDNLTTYIFDIIVYQEYKTIPKDDAILILCLAADAVIEAFDTDETLGGLCHKVRAMPGQWGFYNGNNSNIAYVKLTLACEIERTVKTY
jgi:hypothetical protein